MRGLFLVIASAAALSYGETPATAQAKCAFSTPFFLRPSSMARCFAARALALFSPNFDKTWVTVTDRSFSEDPKFFGAHDDLTSFWRLA